MLGEHGTVRSLVLDYRAPSAHCRRRKAPTRFNPSPLSRLHRALDPGGRLEEGPHVELPFGRSGVGREVGPAHVLDDDDVG
jgi:hypothetical protein